jgi:hypothetical protein
MSQPTVAILLNSTNPPAPGGNQNVKPQSDGAEPQQSISFYPQKATASLLGVVKPDGTTTTVDGSGVLSAVIPATPVIVSIAGITIDGGGLALTTGSKGFLQVPFSGTIIGWTLIGDVSGSASVTVKKSTFAGFPTNASIVAAAPPALTSQQKATSTTLTGWTTAVAAGDVLEFVLTSVATVTRLVLELQITRS